MKKSGSVKIQGRAKAPVGPKYPAKPGGRDGKYEHTAGGKTRQASF